jgi:opacity protein-like surface antigen
MMKPILGMAMVLVAACAAGAQEHTNATTSDRTTENVAARFDNTSAAQSNLLGTSSSVLLATPAASRAEAPAVPAAAPATPKLVFGDRDDYRWQLGLGVEFIRFRSNVLDASIVGVNTTLTYFTNSWFAVEGNVVTAFGPPPNDNNHVKYFGGGGGIRIGGRRARFEPWGHVIVGGAHLQPQTAAGNRTALAVTGGGGLDYRVNSRLSLRAEVDYLYTGFWGEHQDNFQATTGVVFHF